jgi:UDP-glucose 6-dehydrogenase
MFWGRLCGGSHNGSYGQEVPLFLGKLLLYFNKFFVYDINEEIIRKWQSNQCPIYENGLKEIL